MGRKPKYGYDIEIIKSNRTRDITPKETARLMGWSETGVNRWLKNNFVEVVDYIPRKKKKG